ncbi:MAG: hypothetical protein NWE95_11735 [Candidatus Bathyarchaeota archaeon]|nr:hypothetical protein [Candidatus Bathyarchaeota archaeon]
MTATDSVLEEISGKLDKIAKLLAASTIKDYGTEQEKIELLDSMGFTSTEIAKLLNKSIQNVCVQLNLISKKKEKAEKKEPKLEPEKIAAQDATTTEEGKTK